MKPITFRRSGNSDPLNSSKSILVLAVCLWAMTHLSGCGSTVTGGGAGARAGGVEYTLTGVAYRTVNADLTATKRAAVKALKQLDMNPSGPVNTDKGAKVLAATSTLNIKVEMERITSRATKISVDAKARVLRDKATAAEILRRTLEHLGIRN